MKSVGFKDWSIVCEALARGQQTVIVRKGGIAEGRAGFSFQHAEFFLFPTWFHEQRASVRTTDLAIPEQLVGEIEIKSFARVEVLRTIASWPLVAALEPFHILQPEVVRERFAYRDAPGVHIAFVRAYKLLPSWRVVDEKRFGGCRSWIELPQPPEQMQMEPVLSDAEHEKRRQNFLKALGE
jgi:hypothetical protein